MKATRVVESFMVYYKGEESKDFQVPGGVLNRTVCVIYVFNAHCKKYAACQIRRFVSYDYGPTGPCLWPATVRDGQT